MHIEYTQPTGKDVFTVPLAVLVTAVAVELIVQPGWHTLGGQDLPKWRAGARQERAVTFKRLGASKQRSNDSKHRETTANVCAKVAVTVEKEEEVDDDDEG